MTHLPTAPSTTAAAATSTSTVNAFSNDDLFGFMDPDQQAQFAASDDEEENSREKVRTPAQATIELLHVCLRVSPFASATVVPAQEGPEDIPH